MRRVRGKTPGIALSLSCRLVLGVTALVACTSARGSQTAVVTFFSVVNQSGRDVLVRVFADGRELFAQKVDATRSSGDRESVPGAPPYPTRELKVSLSTTARQLVIEEANSGQRATYDRPPGPEPDAGFRIVVRQEGITVTRDYVPARAR